jgi:2',3'-cyclic-nucleotide 2'-phosphodiesterase (5'-nucleotidase family)
LVKNARAEGHPVLVVDSGDLFFDALRAETDLKKARAKAKVIARAYKDMGVVAINVGDGDLLAGLKFLQQGTGQRLPLISANLVDPVHKKPIFPPYIIQEVSGVRIAVFGLSSPPLSPSANKGVEGEALAGDPVEAAQRVVGELKGRADLILLLSDLGLDQDVRVAKAVPGIHFILGGHEGRAVKWPQQEGETFIVQSYQKGMYVGRLALTLEKPDAPFQDEGRVDRLQEEISELERRIRGLQSTKERNPHLDIERAVEGLDQQRHKLQGEMEQARQASPSVNRFRWTLEPISTSLPEDKEVLRWIKASGITSD